MKFMKQLELNKNENLQSCLTLCFIASSTKNINFDLNFN